MPLPESTRLGPYEVVGLLGAGGMGEVYRGRDTRLDRHVAIKVLPAAFAQDAERADRFRRESRVLAALNHPNIVAIFDVGEHEGATYLVTELLEGETLRHTGKMPVRRAVECARQIADALAAAHARGILHRDLKPDNVMLLNDGRVKLLDFGLAKQQSASASPAASTETLTLQSAPGIIVGTVGYISPEQIRGRPADVRSDIFSFGCTLYEILSGRRAFAGASSMDAIGAILRDEPAEIPALPAALERLLRRCLEKDPERRFQSAADLAFVLGNLAESPSAAAPVTAHLSRRVLLPLAAIPAASALLFAGYYARSRWSRPEAPRFQRLTFRPGRILQARFLGDGRTVAYEAEWEGETYSTQAVTTSTGDTRDLAVPEDAQVAAFSKTGELALFLDSRHPWGKMLARRAVQGSPPRELADGVRLVDWGPDGDSIAVVRAVEGKERLEFPIGRVLFELPITGNASSVLAMRVAPDGHTIAFAEESAGVRLKIVDRAGRVRDLALLTQTTYKARPLVWDRTGREVWCTSHATQEQNTILAFDHSGARRVVARFPNSVTLHDISSAGQALVVSGSIRRGVAIQSGDSVRDLSWLDNPWLRYLSADGSTIIFNEIGGAGGKNGSVYIRRTDGSPATRLTDGQALSVSGDGKWIYAESSGGSGRLVPVGAGEGQDVRFPGLEMPMIVAWLGQERFVVASSERGRPMRHFVCNRASGEALPITPEGISPAFTLLMPDHKHLLARSSDSKWRLYPLNGGVPREALGIAERDVPVVWAADGRSVFVAPWGGRRLPVYRVDVATGKRILWRQISNPTPATTITMLRMTPDGRSFAYQYSRESSELYLVDGLN